jgi:biotin carboxylase
MLATLFEMPYRVLRCAQASGAEVYVTGNAGARALRLSRSCRKFFLTECVIHGGRDEALALEINCLARDLGITTVMAGDAPSTRSLIANRDLIEARCFPMPDLATFDRLNDKSCFADLCTELGIPHPRTALLADVSELAQGLSDGSLQCPLVAKPLGRSGGGGVIVLDGTATAAKLKAINYRPILVQPFVPGEDIGASIYARGGKILAFVVHKFWRQIYSTFRDDRTYEHLAKLARHLSLDGVYNFDMRLEPDGTVLFLECNPRFFYKIALSMVAGINFVGYGLGGSNQEAQFILEDVKVRLPKALVFSLATSARCGRRDWRMARYLYSDPLPYLVERLKLSA